jgi:hypothetical protein
MSDERTNFTAPFVDSDSILYRFDARNEKADSFVFGMSGGGAYQKEKFAGTDPIDAFHASRLVVWLIERLPTNLLSMIEASIFCRRHGPTNMFFVQDTRSYHGNAVVWWAKGSGYTSHLDDAQEFDEATAHRMERSRSSDKAWSADLVRRSATMHVDIQRLRKQQMDEKKYDAR